MKIKGFRKDNPESRIPEPGQYGKDVSGNWFGMTPTGMLANLQRHQVIEHPDGTITVSPSILVTTSPEKQEDGNTKEGKQKWHGHLNAGMWEEC